jgi:type I restriction enzyme S subunit
MTGSTGRQRVPRAFLESLEVPLPPLDEQRRVVARLERALAQAGRIANELHELTEPLTLIDDAALRQTFSQVAGPTSKIEDILIEGRYGSSKKADTTPRGVPILRIPNIVQGRIDLSALKYLPLQDGELARLRLEPGDILVCRTNGSRDLVGRAAVFEAEGEYVFASYLIRIRVDPDRADPKFVSAFMNSPQGRDQILRVVRTSAGQYNLNSTAIKNLRLPLPSLAEQHAAVERLERVDAAVGRLLSQHGEARTTLDLALSSLLDAAYRGDS